MARISGLDGNFKIATGHGATPAAMVGVKSWEISFTAEAPLVTGFDSGGWVERVAGLRDWTGSCTCAWETESANGEPVDFLTWFIGSQLATVEFVLDSTRSIIGNVTINGFSVNDAVDGAPEITINFTGVKAPTTVPSD